MGSQKKTPKAKWSEQWELVFWRLESQSKVWVEYFLLRPHFALQMTGFLLCPYLAFRQPLFLSAAQTALELQILFASVFWVQELQGCAIMC